MNVRGGQKIFLAFCAFAAIFSVIQLYRFNQGNNQFLTIFVILKNLTFTTDTIRRERRILLVKKRETEG